MVSTSRERRTKGVLCLDSSCMAVAERTSSERSGGKASTSLTVRVRPCRHNRGPQPGGVKHRHLLFPVLEAGVSDAVFCEPGVGRAVPPKAALPGHVDGVSSLCPHMVVPLYVCVPISSYEDTGDIGLGPTPVTSF